MVIQKFESLLEEESKVVNETCNQMLQFLRSYMPPIDYSFVIAGYFKIIEIEIRKKVFERFTAMLGRKDKLEAESFRDGYFRNVDSFAKFLKKGEPLALGEMLLVLKHLARVPADSEGDVYSKLKAYMRRMFFRPYYFYGKQKLAERVQRSLTKFRNPAIHMAIFTGADFEVFSRIFFGGDNTLGLLNLTIKCLIPTGEGFGSPQ